MQLKQPVYAIFLDIVGFTKTATDTGMLERIEAFRDTVERMFCGQWNTAFPSQPATILPTGDGCLIVLKCHGHTQSNALATFTWGIRLHEQLRKLSALQDPWGVRMGMVMDDAIPNDFAGRPNFTGHSISNCQRIMDFGANWHILMSMEFAQRLSDEWDNQHHRWEGDIRLDGEKAHVVTERCKCKYLDKHRVEHDICNVYCPDKTGVIGRIGNPQDPPRKWSKALRDESVRSFEALIRDCGSFYSITRIRPEEWVIDESLMHVLLTQAHHRRKYKRIIVWDRSIYEEAEQAAKFFLSLNKYAGIQVLRVSPDHARRALSSKPVERARRDAANSDAPTATLRGFVSNELSETWLALKGNGSIKEAGYGKLDYSTGIWTTESLDTGHQYVKTVFDALTECNK
jgi:hypothetical protein